MDEHGVSAADVAAVVGCSAQLVRRVVNGGAVYETRNSRRIKQFIAERVGVTVETLWPDDDGSTGRAISGTGGAQ